jgi:chaperonin GroES
VTLKPFGDRLLVKPDEQPEKIGSIYVPETVNADNPNYFTMTGIVIDKGQGAWSEEHGRKLPIEVEIGERVLFNRYAGKQVQHNGVLHLLLRVPEVLGIVAGEHFVQPGYQAPTWKRPKDLSA